MKNFWNAAFEMNEPLWRYLSPERLGQVLSRSKLYFAAPDQFVDRFEGCSAVIPPEIPIDPRYQPMDHLEQVYFRLRRNFKISCWHRSEYESDAMWKLYAGERKGIAIKTTPGRLQASLKAFRLPSANVDEVLWAGEVRYQDFLVSPRLGTNLMERLYYKHRAFEWEREFRLVISLNEASEWRPDVPKQGIEVEADLSCLIEKVFLGPELQAAELDSVVDQLKKAGLQDRTVKSSLLGHPKFL